MRIFYPTNNFAGSTSRPQAKKDKKADSTLRASRAVPHPSTDRALRRLTSEVGRDPVHSTRYGRQRMQCAACVLPPSLNMPRSRKEEMIQTMFFHAANLSSETTAEGNCPRGAFL